MGFQDSLKLGLSDAIQSVKDAAGILTGKRNTVNQGAVLPWQVGNSVKSRFFQPISIDPKRWDQLFPYRLVVFDTKKNAIVSGQGSGGNLVSTNSAGSAIVAFTPLDKQWIFTLPISPQQLNIQDQYAIQTSATLRGVLEEHSGVRFKLISASGTMGVWPYRESLTKPPSTPSILQSVFGGTIEALGSTVSQISRVINTATSNHPANKPTSIRPEGSSHGETSTGFYQAQALQQFLEQYAEAKKNPENAGWRLVFDIPKQNQSFVVTPMQFVWQQNANKPLEVQYNFQLKAWRRIDLKLKSSSAKPEIQSIGPGILQRVLNTVSEARKVCSAAYDLIGAVRSDVATPLDVLRQTSLFVKDLAGVAVTAADLPFQIQKDFDSAIKDSLNALDISTTSTNSKVRESLSQISSSKAQSEGLSLAAIKGGQLGRTAMLAQSIDPANNVFANPERNHELMDQAPVYALSLNVAQKATVDSVINDARSITVDDLKSFRAVTLELALQLSNNFGAGDEYFSRIYVRPTPTERIQGMTLDEYDILKKLYDVIQAYDILTATTEIDDAQKKTNMEYVAGLADLAGIDFTVPNSKILAPVPFGLSIEEISARYLGDPLRWIEIATLNNLRAPYIDENGFQLPLLSNATGRQITVSIVENLYVGQRVILQSSTQTPSARKILGIDRLSDTSFLVTLDGEANLNNYLLADGAYLQVYLPGTVNSQQKIYIPSDLDVPNDPNIIVPSSTASDPLVALSKVDWLLTDSGDVAVNSFGDIRLSAGMTNIIQALKIKLGTQKGSFLMHPEFGLGIRAGMMSSDVDVQELYNSIDKMIKEDPRFQGLESLQIELKGPTLTINIAVALAGQQGVFPITFQLAA